MTDSSIPRRPFKFTQARLEALPLPERTRYEARDSEQPGLICRVSPAGKKYPAGRKVLEVYRKPKGSTSAVRVSVCVLGELPMTALKGTPSVRSEVDRILAELREGTNPNATRREEQAQAKRQDQADQVADITLGQAFEQYVQIKTLRERTLEGYRLSLNRDLAAWKDKPLRAITGDMAVTRHAELVKTSKSVAMRAMQVLRAVHRFASDFYGTDAEELPFGRCPVDKVNRIQRKWSRTDARTRKLSGADVAPWLAAVRRLPEEQKRGDGERGAAYLEFVLLTALRRREAAFLRWADVDLARGTLTVKDTKNHLDHTLPITRRVREILEERKAAAAPGAEFVFGSAESHWQVYRIAKETGLQITPHDLRRSWASFADKAGLGAYAIKAALNHLSTGDVTGTHYAQIDTDDLRPLMQRVEDHILRLAEPPADNVVELRVGGAR